MMRYESPTLLVVGDALKEVQNRGNIYKNAGGSDLLCGFYCFSELDD